MKLLEPRRHSIKRCTLYRDDRMTKRLLQLLKERKHNTQLSALCLRGNIDKRKLYTHREGLSSIDSSWFEVHS